MHLAAWRTIPPLSGITIERTGDASKPGNEPTHGLVACIFSARFPPATRQAGPGRKRADRGELLLEGVGARRPLALLLDSLALGVLVVFLQRAQALVRRLELGLQGGSGQG